MIHVGHVVAAGEIGGAERMLADLARAPETNARHTLFVFSPSKALVTMFREKGLAVRDRGFVKETPLAFLGRSLGRRDVGWLGEELDRAHVDVVHLHTLASQVLGTRAALARGLPVVRTEHSTRVYDDPTAWPFSRWSLARVDRAICVSEHVREVAKKKAPWAPLSVVYNGIDTERFSPRPRDTRADAPLALAITGRLEPRKGVDRALRALATIPEATLTIAGDGPSRAELASIADALGIGSRVTFLGHVDDVREAIAASDAVICASRTEGLGVAFLEAMAMERPVVGLRTGGVAEIVSDDIGFVAHLAPSSDEGAVHEIADAIARAAADRDGIVGRGRLARARVVEKFSRATMAAAYGAAYRAVSDRSGDARPPAPRRP